MSLITLDMETFYSPAFSLSKMTTEAYIRDPQFEVIGFAYRVDGGESVWVPGEGTEELAALNLHEHQVLSHNAAFDMAILSWRYGIHPKFMFDTLSMARPVTGLTVGGSLAALAKLFCIGEKGNEVINALGKRRADFTPAELARYGEYCKNDVDLTYTLFHVLKQYSTPTELYVIDLLLRMYTDPVITLARPTLERHLTEVQTIKANLMAQIEADGITTDDIMSNNKFADVLKTLGAVPPTKKSAANGKETWDFSKTSTKFKALLEHDNVKVQSVMAARFGVKSTIEETRTQSFIQIAQRGTLPIMLLYYGAHTGRASGGDKVNLQNLPRGGALRYAMRAPDRHVMVAADSSQIEARVLAWFAGEAELLQQFADGIDVYSAFATEVFGYPVDKSMKTERFVGKVGILSLGFGVGKDKNKAALENGKVYVDLAESERIVNLYRAKYEKIAGKKGIWKAADAAIQAMACNSESHLGVGVSLLCHGNGVQLPNGMWLRYPNLSYRTANTKSGKEYIPKNGYYYDSRYGSVGLYGAKLIENIIQALARIIVFNQMCKIDQKLRKYDNRDKGIRFKVALTVHDEVVVVCPEPAEIKVKAMMEATMKETPKWAAGLPITCESASGLSYGECK